MFEYILFIIGLIELNKKENYMGYQQDTPILI